MSCRRIRRELLWLVRFGDFDAGSAPHLDHLASCQDCRDEVGLDRALVRQLRTALAGRVHDASPSPSAWEGVLARMRQPEPSALRPWSARLASLLRAGSAMAGASLALVLALNLEMVPIGPIGSPDASDLGVVSAGGQAGDGAGIRNGAGRLPAAGTQLVREDQVRVVWVLPAVSEQLPLARDTLAAPAPAVPEPRPDEDDDAVDHGPEVVRLVPVDAAAMSASDGSSRTDAPDDQAAPPAAPPAGGPS